MRGAETLIPARFLTLIGHLCVMITLLWESKQNRNLCFPSGQPQEVHQSYLNRLVAGFATSIALLLLEFTTFILGLTMFSPSVSLLSIGAHGGASVALTYFVLDGWACDWFWPIFFFSTIVPSIFDTAAASSNEHQKLTASSAPAPGWSLFLVLAAVATTLGSSLPVGYNIGVVNTPADILKAFCNESVISRYDVTLSKTWLNVLWSAIVSIFIVGGCTGSVLGAMLADTCGRKKATLVTSVLSMMGAVLFLFARDANSVEMLLLGRLLVGLAAGLTTSIVPMYLAELAPLRLTGAVGVVCPMGVNVGVLVGQVMGLDSLLGAPSDWPFLLSVYALLVVLCVPLICVLPESPKYLYVVKGDEEMAIRELSRLRGVSPSLLTTDMELLREESNVSRRAGDSRDTCGMLSVARDKRLRLPLLLACSMQAGQQTSGINAVFYYSQTIFKQAGLSPYTAQLATIGCGAINVCTAAFMVYLLPLKGRRPLLLWSVGVAAGLLTLLAAAMKFMDAVWWMSYVCTGAVLGYVLAYGFGLGPIPYFIASELFEVAPRPAGMAWGSLSNWGGNFLVGMLFPIARDTLGAYCFLIFAGVTAALWVFQKMYFPETRGKTPTEVARLCSRGFSSRAENRHVTRV